MKQLVVPLIVLVGAIGLLWRFPPVRIVRLADAEASQREQAFDAAAFARTFWKRQLATSFDKAADSQKLISAIEHDPKEARDKFGRSVGVSRGYFYFLRGTGVIVAADKRRVSLALGGSGEADVVLLVGPLFGNSVRDATGLLDASDFANSQHFNAISQQLNRIVEAEVLPSIVKSAQSGRRLEFIGCAEVRSEPRDLRPLKVVPIWARFLDGDPQAKP